MYKFKSKQMTINDFNMPCGLSLDANNRWVQKSHSTPWNEYEKLYASLFNGSSTGNVALPAQLMFGALLIKLERNISDEEVVRQIQESHYLQYFCGLSEYSDKPPFNPSSLTRFRKRFTAEMLSELIEMAIPKSEEASEVETNVPSEEEVPTNKGDLLLDATCAPQNIRFPQDISLLNEAREKLEKMIDKLHKPSDGKKPRTKRKVARKDYLSIAKDKKKTTKKLHKAIKKQLKYIHDDIGFIEKYFSLGRGLSMKDMRLYNTILKVYEQQKYMNDKKIHTVENRIVSITQPWIRPIARNKAGAKYEFGSKLTLSSIDGFVRLEHASFDPYNECTTFIDSVERYKKRYGFYPARVLVDQIFRNRVIIAYCRKHKITILGKPLGRPQKLSVEDKKATRKSEIDRIEIERVISLLKRMFSLNRVWAKLPSTSMTSIVFSILGMNITRLARIIFVLFYKLKICLQKNLNSLIESLILEMLNHNIKLRISRWENLGVVQ